jgi:hypothetical protein
MSTTEATAAPQSVITKERFMHLLNTNPGVYLCTIDSLEVLAQDDDSENELVLWECGTDREIAMPIPCTGIRIQGNWFLVGEHRLELYRLNPVNISDLL